MAMMVGNGSGTQFLGLSEAQVFGTTTVLNEAARAKWRAKGRRRRVTPQAGRAIEVLAHAIEYLYDEFALEGLSGEAKGSGEGNSRIAAIDVLKRLNREVYLGCPIMPTFRERVHSLLHRCQG